MKNRYKRTFDGISPIRSDEELLRAVLDRKAENMNTTRKIGKKAVIILVAAVMLAAATVGVGAAYQWNLTAAFESLFYNQYERYNGESVEDSVKERFDFSEVGTEIGESFEGEGYTLTIDGMVAVYDSAYFIYTLRFDENSPYDYAHHGVYGADWFEWGIDIYSISVSVNGEPQNCGKSSSGRDCKWLDERTMQGAFHLYSYDTPIFENNTVTLTIGSLFCDRREDYALVERQTIDCGMTLDVIFDENSVYGAITFAPNETITLDEIGGAVITEVIISPLAVEYTVIFDGGQETVDSDTYFDFWNTQLDSGYPSVTLRDGSEVKSSSVGGNQKDGGAVFRAELDYPIDPADVVSAAICGQSVGLTDR